MLSESRRRTLFDLLALAYNAPLRTRRERADRLLKDQDEFLAGFRPDARRGPTPSLRNMPNTQRPVQAADILEVPRPSTEGNVDQIARFGGRSVRIAVTELQRLLYTA